MRGTVPLIVGCMGKALTVTRGKGLMGTVRLERRLDRANTVFRAAVSSRMVTCLVTERHLRAPATRRTIGYTVRGVGNTCTLIIDDPEGVVNTESPFKLGPLYVKGHSGACFLTSRDYTVTTMSNRFMESILPKRVMAVAEGRKVRSSADVIVSSRGRTEYVFRCVCFTEASDAVSNMNMCRSEVLTKGTLTRSCPMSTSLIIKIPSSNLMTTGKCSRRSKVPCKVTFRGGDCIKEAFVGPGRDRHISDMGVGLGMVPRIMGKGQVMVMSSSVIHKAAYTGVVGVLGGTKTGRMRMHVDSPPFLRPYFFKASIPSGRRLVTRARARRRVHRLVKTSSLKCVRVRGLGSVIKSLGCYSTYFAKGCPVGIPRRSVDRTFRRG